MSPEELARQEIDSLLERCGWQIQNYKQLNLGAARGIAVREVPLKSGRCDYLLLVDRKPVGVIEAKEAGVTLSTVADQSGHYAANLPDIHALLYWLRWARSRSSPNMKPLEALSLSCAKSIAARSLADN